MDQTQNQQPTEQVTQTPAVPVASAPAPVSTPPTPVPAPKGSSLREKFAGLMEKFKSLPKNTRIIVMAVAISFALIVILLIFGILIKGLGGVKTTTVPVATASPVPVATSVPVEISNPSRYATDSAILSLEGEVDGLTRDMSTVDLKEGDLRVPGLDMNVKF